MSIEDHLIKPPDFFVKDIPIFGDLILAPMSGYSDSPDRTIARRFGSALSYSEFVNAIDVVQNNKNIEKRLMFTEMERPVVFQLFDNDPVRIIEAAKIVFQLNPDILDINLGCSARQVTNRGAGASLLKKPELIKKIFSGLTNISSIPITAKMRLGWDETSLNYLEIAKLLEDYGASMIAVHGRTKTQLYKGSSDWNAIAEIKQTVNIPVLANGDVKTVSDIIEIKSVTNCDGVMIGRGSIGNPWLFSHRDQVDIPLDEAKQVILEHLKLISDFYGPDWGHIIFRKHLKAYLRPYAMTAACKRAIVTSESVESLESLIKNIEDFTNPVQ
jgi:nifR3 family TIM-barrel protein